MVHRVRITPEGRRASGDPGEQIIPADPDERMLYARRIICDRCLFGVDINPMAVEMAKLSLWLITVDRGRPFTFLDHALKCGDSLLGLWSAEQVWKFHPDPDAPVQQVLWGEHVRGIFHHALEKRRALESFPVLDIRDTEAKTRLLAEADAAMEAVRLLCDLLIAGVVGLNGDRALEEYRGRLFDRLTEANSRAEIESALDALRALAPEARALLNTGNPNPNTPRTPFHWPLEFPEIFAPPASSSSSSSSSSSPSPVPSPPPPSSSSPSSPSSPPPTPNPPPPNGFSAFLGNPPFIGGQKITGTLGVDYRDYLVNRIAGGRRGSADFCAYFFLRAGALLRPGGMMGLLATNTIAQGDTREVGLDRLAAAGFSLPRAVPSRKWPGQANLEVSHVWMRKGPWHGPHVLDDTPVPGITPFLTPPGRVTGTPFRLAANAGKSFQGSIVLGMGFVMTPEEAAALLARNPRHRDVLFPYLNGEDLNSRWDQSPSRWVINFHDWPLDRSAPGNWESAPEKERKKFLQDGRVPPDYPGPVAADYPECLAIVEERVKPERAKLIGRNTIGTKRGTNWWRYGAEAKELYTTIAGMDRYLVHPLTSKHHSLAFFSSGIVSSHMTVVLAVGEWDEYAVLQGTIHWIWALAYGNKLENRPQYTPSDCFETFPFPADLSGLEAIGARYYAHRQTVMEARREGLTQTYNRFHTPAEQAEDIQHLRALHIEMDHAVAAAYGWADLPLGHGFHQTKQGLRFTLSEPARRELLDRLLALNHQRHAEEEAQGLHEKKKPTPAARTKKTAPKKPKDQGELF